MTAALAVLLAALPARAGGAADSLRERFTGEEAWLLSAILSDENQAAQFGLDAEAAAKGGDEERAAAERRWRKKTVSLAERYKQLLESPLRDDATGLETLIGAQEQAIFRHWFNVQSDERKQEMLADIEKGNAFWNMNIGRDTVRETVDAKRKKTAKDMGTYLASAPALEAKAWAEPVKRPAAPRPPPKAQEALEQAERAAREAVKAPTLEEAADDAGAAFSGTPPAEEDSLPQAGTPAGGAASLRPAGPAAATAGFTIKPPPSPELDQIDRKKSDKGLVYKELAKRVAPAAGGALLGGLLGFLFGGPIGALIGALAGGGAGYLVGKAIFK